MTFPKDILLVDFETTGEDPYLAEPVQIGAVLLDKDTLKEKSFYTSLIKSQLTAQAEKLSPATQEQLDVAPKAAEVAEEFFEKFGTNVILSSWVQQLDRLMLDKIMKASGIDPRSYDYHYFDLWPLAYVHLQNHGYSGGIRSEEMFQAFGLAKREKHDALDDCRREAEILRKILQDSK